MNELRKKKIQSFYLQRQRERETLRKSTSMAEEEEEEEELVSSPPPPPSDSHPTTAAAEDTATAPPPPPPPPSPPPRASTPLQFDPSRMIGIIRRKAMIKDLASLYHAECLAYGRELLELQRKWEEPYMDIKAPEDIRKETVRQPKRQKKTR